MNEMLAVNGVNVRDGALAGKRVLIVEDEYFIASDLKRALNGQNAIVVGPVGDVEAALDLADNGPLDAAILDVNLEGAFSYAIADRLDARGVPFLFLTGYDSWALPPDYREVPRLPKPFSTGALLGMIGQLCGDKSP